MTQEELNRAQEYEKVLKRVADLEVQMKRNTSEAEKDFASLALKVKSFASEMNKAVTTSGKISKGFEGMLSVQQQLKQAANGDLQLSSKKLSSLKEELNNKIKGLAAERETLKNKSKLSREEKTQLREINKLLDANNKVRENSTYQMEKTLELLDKEIAKSKEVEKLQKRKAAASLLFGGIGSGIMDIADIIKNPKKYADKKASNGAYISGAGTGTSDSIPAMLSNGESVINAKSTSIFGGLLSAINVAGGGKKFARGGVAGFAGGGATGGSSLSTQFDPKIPKMGDTAQQIGALFGPMGAVIGKAVGESLDKIAEVLNEIIQLANKYDQATTDTARQLGTTKEKVRDLRREYISFTADVKNAQGEILATGSELLETTLKVNEALGQSLKFNAQQALELTKLVKYTGLTEEQAAKFAGTFGQAVEESESLQRSIGTAAAKTGMQLGVSVNLKKVMSDIAKTSDGIVIKFKGQADALAAAQIQAQKYGLNLEKVDKIGESLLNWESSIENELKAELITGRELNLERARAAALTGSQATLTAEIAQQVGTLEDFTNLNVLAQRNLAEAFGMTREEMSEMLMNQQRINLLGPIAKKSALEQLEYAKANNIELGDALTNQLQQQSTTERLTRAMERLNDTLMGTGGLERAGTAIAEASFKVQTIRRQAVAGTINTFTGNDMYSDYGKRTLITPDGAFKLYNGDQVIAGTKLFKGDDVYSGPKDSLTMGGNVDMSKTNQLLQQQINTLGNLRLTYYAGDAIKTNMQYSYNTFY
jgi:plasmid maintenance system antidote protein VapI